MIELSDIKTEVIVHNLGPIFAALAVLAAVGPVHASDRSVTPSAEAASVSWQEGLQTAHGASQAPGAAVLVIRDGVVADSVFAGVADSETRRPLNAGDIWHLNSNGKAITATLIAVLVEKGVLSWDRGLAEMAPADMPMREEYRAVTLTQLLSHRSGLPENPNLDEVFKYFEATDALPVQRRAYARLALSEAPVFSPGGTVGYSNSGYVIAAMIAEAATGRSFEDLLTEFVFTPLDMSSAGFGPTPAGTNAGHVDGAPSRGAHSGNPRVLNPAGGMHMTMQDWGGFVADQMAGERGQGRLLRAETYRFLHAPVGDGDTALGWGVKRQADGSALLSHTGSDGEWFAVVMMVPARDTAVVSAVNAADASSQILARDIVRLFRQSLL